MLTGSDPRPFATGGPFSRRTFPAIRDALFLEKSQRKDNIKTAASCVSNVMMGHMKIADLAKRSQKPSEGIDDMMSNRQRFAQSALHTLERHGVKVKEVTDLLQTEYGYSWGSIVETMGYYGYKETRRDTVPPSVPESIMTQGG
jgi:hypothetical protein